MRSSALVTLALLTWALTTCDQIDMAEVVPVDKEEPCFCDTDESTFPSGIPLDTTIDENGCYIYDASYCNARSDTRSDPCDSLTIFGRCPSGPTIEGELVTGAACPSDMAADRWMEIDCKVCSCEKESRTLRCYWFPCPVNDPLSCEKGFKPVSVPNIEQPCCGREKCSPMDVCVVGGVIYQPGDTVPPKRELCEDCRCTDEKDPQTSLNRVSCVPRMACEPCQPGYRHKEVPGKCCGGCEQYACVSEKGGTIIKPGDQLKKGKCTFYTCTKDFQMKEDSIVCLHIVCLQGKIETDGCCPVCKNPDV